MAILDEILTILAEAGPCGYQAGGAAATEPTALATIALQAAGHTASLDLARWLSAQQSADGTLGITAQESAPHWPTGWGMVAWSLWRDGTFTPNLARATNWLVAMRGQPMHSVPELGHDATLVGWPWVEGTHSWVEPTAIAALGLAATGQRAHPRSQEAIRLLYDRQLPGGGWNYGNTVVLGQELRPHVQPTGLALLSLNNCADPKGHIATGVRYLLNSIDHTSTTTSLCFAILGLAAQQSLPAQAAAWLTQAAGRTLASDRSPYKLALLTLAWQATAGQLLAGALGRDATTIDPAAKPTS